jgi:mannose-1-phosphate guanylyltransferase/mannose-6-phosphate isomerase
MALAALQATDNGQPEALLLFCPADQHIPDSAAFARTVNDGVAAAEGGAIVTFGIVPSFPSTAYGYIRQGLQRPDGALQVQRFIEKPQAEAAQALLLGGGVLWNAGIFLCRASVLLQALQQHAPDILASCRKALPAPPAAMTPPAPGAAPQWITPSAPEFAACRSQSIDYAVMEHHDDVAVVPYPGAWSDVGSWNAVADLSPADADGNRVQGQGLTHGAHDTYIHAPHRPVVALGTRDLLIIDTPDALLVAHKDCVEQVKDIVAKLQDLQRTGVWPGPGAGTTAWTWARASRSSASASSPAPASACRCTTTAPNTGSWSRARPRSRVARTPSCCRRTSPPTSRWASCTACTTPARWSWK